MTDPGVGIPSAIPDKPVRLMDQFRAWMRRKNYRYKTEQTYVHWVVRYIRFHKMRHPRDMSTPEIEQFLDHLTLKRHCSVATQRTERPMAAHGRNHVRRWPTRYRGAEAMNREYWLHDRAADPDRRGQHNLLVMNRGGLGVISPVNRA